MKSLRIGAVAGIPIVVNPSWLVPLGAVVWFLSFHVYPAVHTSGNMATHVGMAVASAVLFFLSLILHELAHSLVARRYGIPVRSITLFLLGGVAQIAREPRRPRAEFLIAVAGPLTSLALGVLLVGAWWATGRTSAPLALVALWLGGMNAVVAIFNLLPIYPMDGGRLFHALIWAVNGSPTRATSVAAWSGRVISWALIATAVAMLMGSSVLAFGGVADGVWFLLIGLFLESSTRQALYQNRLVSELRGYRARDIMNAEPPVVAIDAPLGVLGHRVLPLNPRLCYFVEDAGALAGILSFRDILAIPEPAWEGMTAGQAMTPRDRLSPAAPDALASDLLLEMESDDLLHMPVVDEGTVVGVVGRERIVGILQRAGLLGRSSA